jgi:deoxyribonuclease V
MNNQLINIDEGDFRADTERFYHKGEIFTGFYFKRHTSGNLVIFQVKDGIQWGVERTYNDLGHLISIVTLIEVEHGYKLEYLQSKEVFSAWIGGNVIEVLKFVNQQCSVESFHENMDTINRWNDIFCDNLSSMNGGFLEKYILQERIAASVVSKDESQKIKWIAGADVAYHELELRMVGALVVLDAETLEVVDQSTHEMDITFPYVPGLFSFREVPPLLEAYKKLQIKPDLIVCDGHGVAHPKGAGMASHLGVELGVPTIGCAKSRLIGGYDEVSEKRGSFSSLMLGDKEIGRVLRTRDEVKPMFVSVGHLVSLDTACEWVLKLCPNYRQPETTRKADALVRTVMKERTEVGYPEK